MIPPEPSTATSSDAERRIFSSLAGLNLGPGSAAVHSLNLSRHDYKAVAEADFVIVCREGVLVLEIKGGGVSCNGGVWEYRDRYGEVHRSSEGPFEQAKSAMFALRNSIRESLNDARVDEVLFGCAVITPDAALDVSSIEWDPRTAIDRRKLKSGKGLDHWIREALKAWQERLPVKKLPVNSELTSALISVMRPDFDRLPTLSAAAELIDARMTELTEQQYHALDLFDAYDRVLLSGGAGSGKTMLALESARREARAGRSVLFVVESWVLASFLSTRAPVGVAVSPRSQLFEQDDGRFDVLILDEAQDLMDIEVLDQLSGHLKGGLTDGRWRIFYDANNQSGLTGTYDPAALELIAEFATGPVIPLRRNCRNTTEIVQQTRLTTGADLGVAIVGHGPPVSFVYPDSPSGTAAALRAQLRRWGRDGISPGEITILSPVPRISSCVDRLPEGVAKSILTLDAHSVSRWPSIQTTFATIAHFKGLENRFVAVVDLECLPAERRQSSLYVAMTRARAGLWVAWPAEEKTELEALQTRNMPSLLDIPKVDV